MANSFTIASELYSIMNAEGGGTVSKYDDALPTEGYYVGGSRPSLIFNGLDDVDRGEIAAWITQNRASFYGVWVDEADGKVYFDVATYLRTRSYAEELGRFRKEIAIWDIKNEAEIRL